MKKCAWVFAVLSIIARANFATAATVVLYDGSAGSGNQTPQSQGWLSFGGTGTPTVSSTGGKTTFDSTSDGNIRAGYSNYTALPVPLSSLVNNSFPSQIASNAYTLNFTMKLDAESHTSVNRAGFSVILLGNNSKGIEIGFWQGEVQAQSDNPLFTFADSNTSFDPTLATHNYALTIGGGTYSLTADNVPVLSGLTRDYTASGPPNPYTLTNYIFLGDDTTSAQASFELSSVSITAAVPEPVSMGLVLMGSLLFARRSAFERKALV